MFVVECWLLCLKRKERKSQVRVRDVFCVIIFLNEKEEEKKGGTIEKKEKKTKTSELILKQLGRCFGVYQCFSLKKDKTIYTCMKLKCVKIDV